MRALNFATAALGLALVAVPVVAAVKAMTLKELMEVTTDTVHGRITAKESFRSDYPSPDVYWTRLTLQGESLRTGEPVTTQVIFLGSHDPNDGYGTSEMPTLQDTRVGQEAVAFFFRDKQVPGEANVVFDLSGMYRVETVFGQPIVIGKGEGAAFTENIRLADVRIAVRATHQQILAERAAAESQAK